MAQKINNFDASQELTQIKGELYLMRDCFWKCHTLLAIMRMHLRDKMSESNYADVEKLLIQSHRFSGKHDNYACKKCLGTGKANKRRFGPKSEDCGICYGTGLNEELRVILKL